MAQKLSGSIVIQGMKTEFDDLVSRIGEKSRNKQDYKKELEEIGTLIGPNQRLVKVLEIIENNRITKFQSIRTGRQIIQVDGAPDKNGCKSINLLFPGNLPFCTCFSFGRQVIRREILFCKHYIAVRLATSLDQVPPVQHIEHNKFDAKIKLIKI